METLDFDHNHFNSRYAGDAAVYPHFYMKPVQDTEESAKAGRPIFKEVEYVRIIAAGNQNNIVDRPARQMDIDRFQAAYARFKEGMDEQTVGTPLSEVTWVNRGQVEDLAYMKIRTVEQLANVADTICTNYAGMYDLKRKAQAFVATAAANAPLTELAAKNEKLEEELKALRALLENTKAAPKGKE